MGSEVLDMNVGDIPNTSGRTAATTETSFRVIEALKRLDSAGVTELAEELGLAKSTVHKHLNTLQRLDYVVKDDTYQLSVRFLELGIKARSCVRLNGVAREPLEKLAEATGETANVMIVEHGRGVYLMCIVPENIETPPIHEGERVPLHATAGGKAILAYTSDERCERILDHHGLSELTSETITDRTVLQNELQVVHDTRTAYDRGEHKEERYCLASPITDVNRDAVGAVTLSGPEERMDEKLTESDFPSLISSTTISIQNRLQTN